jgi:hypothetical protein
MDKTGVRIECLKLAASRATPGDIGTGVVNIAKIYESYVMEGVKPRKKTTTTPDKLPEK